MELFTISKNYLSFLKKGEKIPPFDIEYLVYSNFEKNFSLIRVRINPLKVNKCGINVSYFETYWIYSCMNFLM